MVRRFSESGLCDVLRPYIHTATIMPKMLYSPEKRKRIVDARVDSCDDSAVRRAEYADSVNEYKKLVSYTASIKVVEWTPS